MKFLKKHVRYFKNNFNDIFITVQASSKAVKNVSKSISNNQQIFENSRYRKISSLHSVGV